MPPKKALSSKEQHLFKELLSFYETKQLKKGIKTADQILKKAPDSGETLCMKGLILTHMGKREEGLDLVKKGIRLDLTSHICWHVFGLIQKGEKNYEEALKSYSQALRFDKENLNLLTDVATLQTHLRQYDSLQDTRETILKLRPNLRRNWISLALAYHLNGNLSEAKKVLDCYQRILKEVPDYDVEHSDVLLYQIRILEEAGEFDEALSLLDTSAKSRAIVNRSAIMEFRARLLSKLGNKPEAEQAWRLLIEKNSECFNYYYEFFKLHSLSLSEVTDADRDKTKQLLQDLASHHPRAVAPHRFLLDILEGPGFEEAISLYISDKLKRGIPSLFVDLKGLYANPSKQQAIERVALSLKDEFERTSQPSYSNDKDSEAPTTFLWTLYFLSQHYSYLRRFEEALATVDAALKHSPTLPELYTCKARILKRAGDLFGAVHCIEEARNLDGQDRFLNTKSAKYHLRAGLPDEAVAILGLFTKKDASSPSADLEDMQSMLYLIEDGDCQNRLGRLGPALKRYLAVENVYEEMFNDQYDFHSYSIRRFTLDSYLSMIDWENKLRLQPPFVHSALGAARIYIIVHDNPDLANTASQANRSEAEKKANKKAKKAAIKNMEESKKVASTNASSNEDKGLEPPSVKDEDPTGAKALASTDGLEHAWKLLKPLVASKLERIDVHICVYDVSVRRRKFCQASKALLAAHALDSEDHELHVRVVDYKQRISSLSPALAEPVQLAVSSSLAKLLPEEISLETFNSQYLQRHSTTAKAVLSAAEVSHKLKAPVSEVESTVFGLFNPEVTFDVKTAFAALQFLVRIKSHRLEEFRGTCDKHFPLSTIFKTAEELSHVKVQNGSASGADDALEDKEAAHV